MGRPRIPKTDGATDPGSSIALRAKGARNEMVRLTASEALEGLALTRNQLRTLDAIIDGLPVKNSRERLAAIRLKVDATLARPAQALDVRSVTFHVVDPFAALPAVEAERGEETAE